MKNKLSVLQEFKISYLIIIVSLNGLRKGNIKKGGKVLIL